jgi:hypothetical protein
VKALKWIGYVLATIAVLSLAAGFAALVAFGAALVFAVGLVMLIASFIRSL